MAACTKRSSPDHGKAEGLRRLALAVALSTAAAVLPTRTADAATALASNKAGDVGLCGGNGTEARAQQCALQKCFQNKGRLCEPVSSCNVVAGGWVAVAALPAQTRVVLTCGGADKEAAEKDALTACKAFGEGCRIMFSSYEDPKDFVEEGTPPKPLPPK